MSYEVPGFRRSYDAAGDLSANQFRYVKLNSDGEAEAVAVAGDIPLAVGVQQNKPVSVAGGQTEPATVMIDGVSMVIADEAVTAGNPVYVQATGGVGTSGAIGAKAAGLAETTAAVGEVAAVLLKPLAALADHA